MNNIPVLYINLEKRKDRKEHIEKQFEDFHNVERVDAIDTNDENKSGYFGCVLSHIKCLELARDRNYDEVIICEDDFEWTKKDVIYPIIDFDVFMIEVLIKDKKEYNNYYRILKGEHTGCYLVKKHYYQTLIDCFKESYELLKKEFKRDYYLDVYIQKLQLNDIFITTKNQIGRQMEDYSDIQKKIMKRYLDDNI